MSQTYEGTRHDKKIVDEENPTYPVDIGVYKDTGFQGYEPEGVKTFQPQKKPKGKELTPEQKEQNSLISSIRIVIEHIIAGISPVVFCHCWRPCDTLRPSPTPCVKGQMSHAASHRGSCSHRDRPCGHLS